MTLFLSYLINGISLGSVYAIIALGYTMVYGIAKMLNFAHGDVIMIGAFICFSATQYLGVPALLGVLLSVAVCTVLGITIAANWGIVAAHIGSMMGLGILDSAQRLGPHLAWTYAGLLNGPTEWLYLGLALLLGWRLAR